MTTQRLTKEERDAIRKRVEAVKPYKNTFDNIVQPVVDFHEHAKEDIPRLLDALEAAEADVERLRKEREKLIEALRWYADREQIVTRARDMLKELGLE